MIKTIAVFQNIPHRKGVWGYDVIYTDDVVKTHDLTCYNVEIDHVIREVCRIMGKNLTLNDFSIYGPSYALCTKVQKMEYKITTLQNMSGWTGENPTIKISIADPDWEEALEAWKLGYPPTSSPEWEKGVFALSTQTEL